MYKCKFCIAPIVIHEDFQTGNCWTQCENKDCSHFNEVFTYIDIREYREI